MFRKKDKISVGYIKDNKLQKFDNRVCWDLDNSLAIILRDTLRFLAEHCAGYPDCYNTETWERLFGEEILKRNDKISKEDWDSEVDNDKQYYLWVRHLKEIADKFDFYTKNAYDLLDKEDNEFLEMYYKKYLPVSKEMTPIEIRERREEISNKVHNITQNQQKAVKEACEELGKIFPSLWD